MDLYSALADESERLASSPQARSSFRRWGRASPLLAAFHSPHDVLAAVAHGDESARSAALFADLVEAASCDGLARHAVLISVIPQASVHRHPTLEAGPPRWRVARATGP